MKVIRSRARVFAIGTCALLGLLVGCSDNAAAKIASKSGAFEAAAELPRSVDIARVATKSGISEGIADDADLTLFIPSDSATTAYVKAAGVDLDNADAAAFFLKCHAVQEAIAPEAFEKQKKYTSMCGLPVQLSREGKRNLVNGIVVTESAGSTTGRAYAVENVLIPAK